MQATIYEIGGRCRDNPLALASVHDFELGRSKSVEGTLILRDPHISLYTLDFENERAIFVQTPPDIDLTQVPFYYTAQYENAQRVLTLPFNDFIDLAETFSRNDNQIVFIHSVGRAGSTLASQLFAQVDGVINISEPDALTVLVVARFTKIFDEEVLKSLLMASVRLLCKTPTQTAWVIKGRGVVIELGDWLHTAFPNTPNVFLYRQAETWLHSCLRSFVSAIDQLDEEKQSAEKMFREFMTPLTPLLAQYDQDQHLGLSGILTLIWLSIMECYLALHEMKIAMLAIPYKSWQIDPQATAAAMLDYCNCLPEDLNPIFAALGRDSQAGSYLSREAIAERGAPPTADIAEFKRLLQNHPTIQSPDFEVPNTLRLT